MLEPFNIYKPKEIIISDIVIFLSLFIIMNLYIPFQKKSIDIDNIYLGKEKFDINEIFFSEINSFNFLLKAKNEINMGEYKIIKRDLKSCLLSSLVSPEKKYINYSKDSEYFSNQQRKQLIDNIFAIGKKKGILFIHAHSGLGKTVT